jgi:hypothetical protein
MYIPPPRECTHTRAHLPVQREVGHVVRQPRKVWGPARRRPARLLVHDRQNQALHLVQLIVRWLGQALLCSVRGGGGQASWQWRCICVPWATRRVAVAVHACRPGCWCWCLAFAGCHARTFQDLGDGAVLHHQLGEGAGALSGPWNEGRGQEGVCSWQSAALKGRMAGECAMGLASRQQERTHGAAIRRGCRPMRGSVPSQAAAAVCRCLPAPAPPTPPPTPPHPISRSRFQPCHMTNADARCAHNTHAHQRTVWNLDNDLPHQYGARSNQGTPSCLQCPQRRAGEDHTL